MDKLNKMTDKLKVKVYHVDAATAVETLVDAVIEFDYEDEDMDIELELVHDAQGNPLLRVKESPKY